MDVTSDLIPIFSSIMIWKRLNEEFVFFDVNAYVLANETFVVYFEYVSNVDEILTLLGFWVI